MREQAAALLGESGPDHDPGRAPVAAVLSRLRAEMGEVANLIERLEPLLLDDGHEGAGEPAERMHVLQGIDLAVQKLRGMSDFVATMADGLPDAWHVDIAPALGLLKLADLRRRLMADAATMDAAEEPRHAAGDIELF